MPESKAIPYVFYRAEGFYPVTLGSDLEAIANAFHNPGTLKVTDSGGRVVYDIGAATPLPIAQVDLYLDLILRASGSRLANYTMESSKTAMRYALCTAIYAATQPSPLEQS